MDANLALGWNVRDFGMVVGGQVVLGEGVSLSHKERREHKEGVVVGWVLGFGSKAFY